MLKKRIGIVMYQTSKSKGQELVAQRMTREFINLGHEAYLITSVYNDGVKMISRENLKELGGYAFSEDNELGIPVIRVDSYIAKWPPRRIIFRDFISTLEKIVEKFQLDVLITHSTLWNGPEEVAKFVEWRRYMKNIGGYCDPLVFCHMSHFQEPSAKRYSLTERSFRVAWNKLTLPQIFSTANLVLVVTPLERAAKLKMGAKPEQLFLYPCGVDDKNFLPYANVESTIFDRRRIKKDAKIISYFGSIEERKNPFAILKVEELLKDRKDIHFVLAGKGDSAYARKVIKTAKGLRNVSYFGELDNAKKISLMKSSYANLLLSRSEALGITQLEFMYWGVPVITSAIGGQAWLIRNKMDGIHVNGPDDITGAAAAVTELVNNPKLRRKLSTNATERAMNMTVSKFTAELDKALTEELIKERGLTELPTEARITIADPENVLKSWSSGSWGVIATARRIFIKRGLISMKVTEIPYSIISSIEYMRRYSWKTLLVGSSLSLIFLVQLSIQPIFSRELIARISQVASFLPSSIVGAFLNLLPVLPLTIATLAFAFLARTGYILRGPGLDPVYLPRQFKDAVAFIRTSQNQRAKQHAEVTVRQLDDRNLRNKVIEL